MIHQPSTPDAAPEPLDGFSARTATFLVVSSTIGGGILGAAGYVALDAGGHPGAILIWAVGGLIAACGALSLAEVSASLPKSGGEFVILSEAYGPLVGFLGGWVSLVFGFISPIAATALVAASYLLAPMGWAHPVAVRAVATIAIVALAVAHSAGRSRAERVQGATTSATIAVLALFVVAGLVAGWRGSAHLAPSVGPMSASGFFVGLILVSYAYTGWNAASYVAGEVANPRRDLPRAVVAGLGIVLVLYLGIVMVIGVALPVPELARLNASDPLALEHVGDLAADRLFGARGAAAMSWAMGVVLAASLSALVMTGPRVAVAMAREGRLPAILGQTSAAKGGESHAIATSAVAVAAVAVLWSGGFRAIAFASGVGLALNSLLTVAAVFVLRAKQPDLPRPFRTPGYPLVPIIFLGLTASSLAFACASPKERPAVYAGLGGVALGIPAYFLTLGSRKPTNLDA